MGAHLQEARRKHSGISEQRAGERSAMAEFSFEKSSNLKTALED